MSFLQISTRCMLQADLFSFIPRAGYFWINKNEVYSLQFVLEMTNQQREYIRSFASHASLSCSLYLSTAPSHARNRMSMDFLFSLSSYISWNNLDISVLQYAISLYMHLGVLVSAQNIISRVLPRTFIYVQMHTEAKIWRNCSVEKRLRLAQKSMLAVRLGGMLVEIVSSLLLDSRRRLKWETTCW